MDEFDNGYRVFVHVDEFGRIVEVNSSAFLTVDANGAPPEGWVEIDAGVGDRYHHAQGNYFADSLMDDRGVQRYVYISDAPEDEPKWRVRTAEEMDADFAAMPAPETEIDKVAELSERVDDMTLLLADMIGGGAV